MSEVKVNKISPRSGTAVTLGDSGDKFTVPSGSNITINSGASITNDGTATGFDTDTNDKVKVSTNDTTPGFLNGKLVAGTNITLTEGSDGGNETFTAAFSGNLNASVTNAGTFADARIPDLNASKITAGTIATARLGSGTASSSTFLRGDQTYASAAGGLQSVQFFSSSGTYTRPAGISKIRVYITGGGGAGGNGDSGVFYSAAGSGGAGGTAIELIDASSMTTVAVTIGAGAIRGGANSGTSSFGSFCSAKGGGNGGNTNGPTNTLGGYAIGGDLNLYGQGGGGSFAPTTQTQGVFGGNSYWGGGAGGIYSQNGVNGAVGGGGSGGNVVGSGGGNGGSGLCYIEEYA